MVPPLPRADRLASIADALADPPRVHGGAPGGVWGTAPECYRFIAEVLPEDATTLETGLGISTSLLGRWTARHVCVVGSADQVEALTDYSTERGHSLDHVDFHVGTSDVVLPGLDLPPVDLFLIDGGHGYPAPVIDWYYGALSLRDGGVVVIDDVQLPSVYDFLVRYLEQDPRWLQLAGDHKWRAFRKVGDFSVREEWTSQSFLGPRRLPFSTRLKVATHRLIHRSKG